MEAWGLLESSGHLLQPVQRVTEFLGGLCEFLCLLFEVRGVALEFVGCL